MPISPLIACFHGGGSNAAIFQIQCYRLAEKLTDKFEFVYFDAPFECAPGPGVLPAFKDKAPFRTWFTVDEGGNVLSDGSGFDHSDCNGLERVKALMRDVAPLERWVAVLGFSQGTRVAAGLLLDSTRRTSRVGSSGGKLDIKFGVLCMGSGNPMHKSSTQGRGPSKAAIESEKIGPISKPTIHLHGLKDVHLEAGRKQLASHFTPDSVILYEIPYHHAMPWATKEIQRLADLITDMLRQTTIS